METKRFAEEVMLIQINLRNVDIDNDGKNEGFQFDLRNPFYTATPISCIKGLPLKIDGKEVDADKVFLIVRGQEIPLTKAYTFHEIWWTLGEVITVFVEKPGGLEPGKHRLEGELILRTTVPYGWDDLRYPINVVATI